uniref:Uncharacterized protein n=1 Tax=Romanomermis culicivorax TaxID=13658 RepID=A0A915HWC4_ROMCU
MKINAIELDIVPKKSMEKQTSSGTRWDVSWPAYQLALNNFSDEKLENKMLQTSPATRAQQNSETRTGRSLTTKTKTKTETCYAKPELTSKFIETFHRGCCQFDI